MTKQRYDFTLEFMTPEDTLYKSGQLINGYAKAVHADDMPLLTVDDETDILITLFGLGRLVEVNVRWAWEVYSTSEGVGDPAPRYYNDVLKQLEKNFINESLHYLLRRAMVVTDGLVHGNFFQASNEARRAYSRSDLGMKQPGFNIQTIVTATVGKGGLTVDAITGVATTTDGQPVPHKSYVPSKNKNIRESFESVYYSAAFVFIYDVLLTAFARAYHFRKCIEAANVVV